jgi:uncharacterized delta-60 repeat protein/uncharacterized repeat protein (TIGR01451 family)
MSKTSSLAERSARVSRRALVAVALAAFVLLQFVTPVLAVNLSSFTTPVTQDFDNMSPNFATATLAVDYRADKHQGVRVVGSYASAGNATEKTGGPGLATNADGGIYNFGSGSTLTGNDRAVGFLSSGSVNGGNLYVKLTNTTGRALTGLRLSYDVEKYRTGSNPAGFRFQLFYSTTGASGSWVSAGSNFLTSFPTDGATLAGCNPAPCSTTPVTNQTLALPAALPNNSDLYLAWNYAVTSGSTTSNAQALGIDNVSILPLVTFGDGTTADGIVTTDAGGTEFGTPTDDAGYALARQSDGKLVVGGYVTDATNGDREFAVVRYTQTGALDTTFGGNGVVTLDFNGGNDRIWGLVMQSDGKIVVAGESFNPTTSNTDFALARFNADGTPDATFGTAGRATTDHLGANNSAYSVALSGSNIVVAGVVSNPLGNRDFMVARYNSLGALDPTFNALGGTPGYVITGFNGFDDVARAVAVQTDGKIVAGGYARNSLGDDDFAAVRYNTDGSLDNSFGINGLITTNFEDGSADQAFGMALDSSAPQKIILVGTALPVGGKRDFALVRYNANGGLDSTFSSDGIQTTDLSDGNTDIAHSVAVQPDGKIVVAGFSIVGNAEDFALARYNATGAPDTGFGSSGKRLTSIATSNDRAYGVVVQPDGKIVAAGFTTLPGSSPVQRDFAIVRYNSAGSLDADTGLAPAQPVNLVLTMADSIGSVVLGDEYSYTLTVTNKGPGVATGVSLVQDLPAEVTFVSAQASHGTVSGTSTLTNSIGTLTVGQTATLQVTVSTASATPKLVNSTATVTSNEPDTNTANNSASEPTRILGISNLSFNPATVVGGCAGSTATVTLSGKADTGGVTVTLASDDAAASVPPSVFIPQGSSSANFTVQTSAVTSTRTPKITATLGLSSYARKLTVTAGQCGGQ